MEKRFSIWYSWNKRDSFENIRNPGIYCIAISRLSLVGSCFEWLKDIKYIGMTNARAGLKGRLKQFDNTIIGKRGHGGADRFRFKYENYNQLVKNLYVSMCAFECDVESNNPADLRIMGNVSKFEYDCLAEYVELYDMLPEFNDKVKSPKYSLTKGRE